jgi:VWFA-related protein
VTVLAGLVAGVLAGSAGGAQQPPVFRAGVESVYVDVFVTRGGAPVLGLDASHFELRDEGRLQRPELLAMESVPLTTLLVFDTSDSVRGAKLEALRAAAGAFLDGLRPLDEVGLIAFSHEVRWLARPTRDKAGVRGALARLTAEGATAVWDALAAAMTVLPTASRSLVVVFSDGQDTLSWLDADRVRAQAARSNALVQVVGFLSPAEAADGPPGFGVRARPFQEQAVEIGEPAYVEDLRRVAELTGGRFWPADSSTRLAAAFRAVVEAMNTRYVLRYDPGPDAKPGHHRIEVRLKGAKGEVRARQGYWRVAR